VEKEEKEKIIKKVSEKVELLLRFFDIDLDEVEADIKCEELRGVNIVLRANNLATTQKLVGKNASTIKLFRECFKKWGIWNGIHIFLFVEPYKE